MYKCLNKLCGYKWPVEGPYCPRCGYHEYLEVPTTIQPPKRREDKPGKVELKPKEEGSDLPDYSHFYDKAQDEKQFIDATKQSLDEAYRRMKLGVFKP